MMQQAGTRQATHIIARRLYSVSTHSQRQLISLAAAQFRSSCQLQRIMQNHQAHTFFFTPSLHPLMAWVRHKAASPPQATEANRVFTQPLHERALDYVLSGTNLHAAFYFAVQVHVTSSSTQAPTSSSMGHRSSSSSSSKSDPSSVGAVDVVEDSSSCVVVVVVVSCTASSSAIAPGKRSSGQ